LLRFGAVGAVGFVVDAGIVVAIVTLANVQPLAARITSFLVAATVTFVLNQRFTFRLGGGFSVARWSYYLTTTAIGACINVGVYQLWLSHVVATPCQLVIGTALGSLAAMVINYFSSSVLVFRAAKQRLPQ
jgi:putative flippase GtrA